MRTPMLNSSWTTQCHCVFRDLWLWSLLVATVSVVVMTALLTLLMTHHCLNIRDLKVQDNINN